MYPGIRSAGDGRTHGFVALPYNERESFAPASEQQASSFDRATSQKPVFSDFDVVLGSRMNRAIWTGANMGFFMKWGELGRREILGILQRNHASDVGCTMRLISRPVPSAFSRSSIGARTSVRDDGALR